MTIIHLTGRINEAGKLEVDLPENLPPGEVQLTLEVADQPKQPKQSLYGLWADLGTAPSAEEIDEARREAWANFPRDDF